MSGQAKIAEPRRLYQQIADQIRELIDLGEFLPGTRLPAERELAQKLGVSRPSLREALIALEIDNTVEIRMGSGVYVSAEALQTTHHTKSLGDSPSELMQARAVIELMKQRGADVPIPVDVVCAKAFGADAEATVKAATDVASRWTRTGCFTSQ